MKNKNLFLKIYISIIILFTIAIIVMSALGNKTRIGYLDFKELKLNDNITNYGYGFQIKYYDKIFRNSDIYGVYIDTEDIIKENSFIKEIKMDYGGSPFGNLISSKIIDSEKIEVKYDLKLKFNVFLIYFFIILYFFVLKSDLLIDKLKNAADKKKVILNTILYISYVVFILILIRYHEPWRDEGQTWLLARDLNWLDLFLQTGAEGHPFLWSFVLKPFTSLPFEPTLFIINLSIVFLAVYLLLFKSNLGILFSFAILLTPMIAYEYPIVARHYGLTFLLFISMIIAYRRRFEKPIIYALILFLFVNSTVMGSIICILESFIFLYEVAIKINKDKNTFKKYIVSIFISIASILSISFQILMMFYIRIFIHKDIDIFPNDKAFYVFAVICIAMELIFLCLSFWHFATKKGFKELTDKIVIVKIVGSVLLALIVNSVYTMGDRHSFIMFLYISGLILDYFRNKYFTKNKRIFYSVYIFITFLCLSLYSIDSGYYLIKEDVEKDFSGAKKAAAYIKDNNLDDTNKYFLIAYDHAPWFGAVAPYFDEKIINFAYKQKEGSFTDYRYWSIRDKFIEYDFITNLNRKAIVSIGPCPNIENIKCVNITNFEGVRETIKLYLITNK